MKKKIFGAARLCGLVVCALALFSASQVAFCETHSREEVRKMYAQLCENPIRTPYESLPDLERFLPGSLTEDALEQALNNVKFIRYLAYLPYDLALSEEAIANSQAAALLLAATNELSHTPSQPEGMPPALYETGYAAASSSNIASFNWFTDGVLLTGLEHFMLDEADYNLPTLGHRRWILSPQLQYTGFGLANSASGISYVVMHVMDFSGEDADYGHVAWPSAGAFPAEYMSAGMPWSVSLQPESYNLEASSPTVTLKEQNSGAVFAFALPSSEIEAQYFAISREAYGEGACIIFRPDLAAAGLAGYEQNQIWQVSIDGLVAVDGATASLEYTVEIISLEPIEPAAVEIEPQTLALKVGETAAVEGIAVPSWADDTSVRYESSDPAIAAVDANGRVTAISAGECEISAIAANGLSDICTVSVDE